jgi:hypothetical protein
MAQMGVLYLYNLFQILLNVNRYGKHGEVRFGPAFRFLGKN